LRLTTPLERRSMAEGKQEAVYLVIPVQVNAAFAQATVRSMGQVRQVVVVVRN
jgi:hypothetical protein